MNHFVVIYTIDRWIMQSSVSAELAVGRSVDMNVFNLFLRVRCGDGTRNGFSCIARCISVSLNQLPRNALEIRLFLPYELDNVRARLDMAGQ